MIKHKLRLALFFLLLCGEPAPILFASENPEPGPARVMAPCVTSAGADQNVCTNAGTVTLEGSVTPASAGLLWATSGTGSYDDNSKGDMVYTPSAADVIAGSVTFTITNQQNDGCGGGTVTDDITVYFSIPGPAVSITTSDYELCESVLLVPGSGFGLTANLSNAGGVLWSGGAGVFTPSPTDVNAVYVPAAADYNAIPFDITVTTTGNGSCNAATSVTSIKVQPLPRPHAGGDHPVCGSAGTTTLIGTAFYGSEVQWSGGEGFIDDPTANNTNYTFGSNENTGGVSSTFYFQATGYGACAGQTVTDDVIITFTGVEPVYISEPSIHYVCKSTIGSGVPLNATTAAPGVSWSGGAAANFSPGTTSNSITYLPTPSELNDGTVLLSVETTGDPCGTDMKSITLYFDEAPLISPLTPVNSACGQAPVPVSALASYSGLSMWTGGNGTFDDPYSSNTNYNPTPAEVTAGSAIVTYQAQGIGGCSAVTNTESLTITITGTGSVVTVPPGFDHCSNTPSVTLTATSSTGTGHWSGGSGDFDNVNNLTVTYTFEAGEIAGENYPIVLTFTSDDNAGCPPTSEDVVINRVIDPLVISGMSDQTICSSQPLIQLFPVEDDGKIYDYDWLSTGTGNLEEHAKGFGLTYTFSAADQAAGTVTITLATSGGPCPAVNFPAVITIQSSSLVIMAGDDQAICMPDQSTPIQLAGSVSTATEVTWTVIDGDAGSFTNPLDPTTTYTVYPDKAQVVTLRLSATDEVIGCVVADEMTITVSNPIILDYPDAPTYNICADDVFDLEATNATAVTWGTVGGTGDFIPDENAMIAQYDPAEGETTVTFTINATAGPGCPNENFTVPYFVNVFPLPEPDAGLDQILCHSSVITMAAATPGNGGEGEWSTDQLTPATIDDPDAPNTTITPHPAYDGSAEFVWSVREPHVLRKESGGSCHNSDTVTISYIRGIIVAPDNIPDAPAGDVMTLNVAANDNYRGLDTAYTLTYTILNEHVVYAEDSASIEQDGILTFINRTKDIGVNEMVVYQVSVCGLSAHDTVTVTLRNGAPILPDSADVDTLFQKVPKAPIIFAVDFTERVFDYNENVDWGTYKFISSTSGIVPDASSEDGNIVFSYTNGRPGVFTGTDVIEFEVYDTYGEKVTVKYYVEILPDYENPSVRPDEFVVINALSPNNDGVNDYLYVYGLSEYHNTVSIYNRWSEKVWEAENYDNNIIKFEGNGNVKNMEGQLPEGTYFYVIKNDGKDENDEKAGLHSGYIEIRR